MSTEKNVTTLSVGNNVADLVGKAVIIHNPTTGDATAFSADKLYNGSDKWYGVEWYTGTVGDFTDGQTTLIRIGNMDMHRNLPLQSRMRACLLNDDGTVREYLTPNAWAAHILDGTMGQVMIEICDMYVKYEDDVFTNLIRRQAVKMSEEYFPGATFYPKRYIGAYEASLDSNSMLSSIKGVTPTTSISRTNFRAAARRRNTNNNKWNIMTYETWKLVFWLFTVEYATRNCQADINTSRDANGCRQGGLGIGMSNVSNWPAYNGYYPIVNTGESDTLGNGSGEVQKNAAEYVNNSVTLVTGDNYVHCARYRGIEHPFGHIFKWTDGINIEVGSTNSTVYVTDNPELFIGSDSNNNGMEARGNEARSDGYNKVLIFGSKGEIIASEVGAGSSSYWCDYHYQNSSSNGHRGVLFGGGSHHGANCGFGCSLSYYAPSGTHANVGSRLCYLP